MKISPRNAKYDVSAVVHDSPLFPVPYAESGTVMSLTRVTAEWSQTAGRAWHLNVVTVRGAANNGSAVTVDYYPDNPTKQPPKELSEWIASTRPGREATESAS